MLYYYHLAYVSLTPKITYYQDFSDDVNKYCVTCNYLRHYSDWVSSTNQLQVSSAFYS